MARYWLDTEFIEYGGSNPIELLSIGLAAEDGREIYLQTAQAAFYHKYPQHCLHEWVRENVVPHLNEQSSTRGEIKQKLLDFCSPNEHGQPEFWADYASYDWVVFCGAFGTMMELPQGFPMYCNDIQQWRRDLGNPVLPQRSGIEHNALEDARDCKRRWEFLKTLSEDCVVERKP